MTSPTLCPVCSCPIQRLSADNQGTPTGTIQDALDRHSEVVHPDQRPEL